MFEKLGISLFSNCKGLHIVIYFFLLLSFISISGGARPALKTCLTISIFTILTNELYSIVNREDYIYTLTFRSASASIAICGQRSHRPL